ncbi:MAG: Fic/DOC family N-terminal domain-containing protein [Acidobacteriota bacterium]
MDASKFTNERTGSLVSISSHSSGFAFIPNPLPPDWEFSNDLWPMVAEARQILGELDGIGRTVPTPDLLLQPLQKREALTSSSLEGTYATPEQMFLFEFQQQKPRATADAKDPTLEVVNYSEALRNGYLYLKEKPLSLDLVCKLHQWLMGGVHGEEQTAGKFRTGQVQIGSEARFVPPPVEDMMPCLENFEQRLQVQDDAFDSLVRCYLMHYQFEAIHPFRDGNGRVGRLLLALMTGHWCGMSMPWLYMSAFFEKHKDEYVGFLFNVSARGEWTEWIRFCLRGTISQAKDAIRRCDLLNSLKELMHKKADGGSGRLHRIVDGLFAYPLTTIPMIAKAFEIGYPTAKSDIEQLIKMGILDHLGDSHHPKVFFATGIAEIAYMDLDD